MTIYIALLRGINVSGQKLIKMDQLKSIFESLEFQNVKTYIQSGNVIFQSVEEDTNVLCNKIENKLRDILGYEVPVIIRTISELQEVIKQNPFSYNDIEKLYFAFLSKEPTSEAKDKILSYKKGVDDFIVLNREVYIFCENGYGNTIFSNNFFEKKLGVSATTRNWKTVNKILDIAESLL